MQINSTDVLRPAVARSQWVLLVQDVCRSINLWRLWVHLGWEDIAKQYRRSFLGPVWISLNTAIFVVAFGFIGAQLFKISIDEYLPYFCLGNVLFGFISGFINEGCQTFTASEAFLKQTPYPKFAFSLRVVWRHLILLGHSLPIALGVLIWAGQLSSVKPGWFMIGLIVSIVTASLFASLIGALSARFRDVPMIISSIMQISFFVTPIMWKTSQITERAQVLVNFNPLAAYLDILRAPMLGQTASGSSWVMVGIVLGLLCILFCTLFLAARRRIVYWI